MLFTSLVFALFFVIVWMLYWFAFPTNLQRQNVFLLICSYIFYGWWNWQFLGLLVGVSLANYGVARWMVYAKSDSWRLRWLVTGLGMNIGVLILFRYLNFFTIEFMELLQAVGLHFNPVLVNLVQPIGISFFLFLAISYLVDVYQRKIPVEKNPVNVALSISFFPIMLAGPVHRPAWLLPQIREKRVFDSRAGIAGLRQILWGLFMKVVIADHCAIHVDTIFNGYLESSGNTLALGLILFTIQIYADFAGYSHMAIGMAGLLGFTIIRNFDYPYFARDIRHFWRKWNISLTLWFRDYVFLPVAYFLSRKWKRKSIVGLPTENLIYIIGIVITWSLTGLWHGANQTFVVWGLLHGSFLIGFHLSRKFRKRLYHRLPGTANHFAVRIPEGILTLFLVMIAWLFFRAASIPQALTYGSHIFSLSFFSVPHFPGDSNLVNLLLLIGFFFLTEWFGRKYACPLDALSRRWSKGFRWLFYYALLLIIIFFNTPGKPFIYFQF